MATYYHSKKQLTVKLGSPYYIAPEILNGRYSKECDMWSVGVLAYAMLVNSFPFEGRTVSEIFSQIRKKTNFNKKKWKNKSKNAYKFVFSLLKKDPWYRLTPEEALNHPFLQENSDQNWLRATFIEKLVTTDWGDLFKTEIWSLFSTYIDSKSKDEIDRYFHSLDTEGTGVLKVSQILTLLENSNIEEDRFYKLHWCLDSQLDSTINYKEFIARVCLFKNKVNEENIEKVYNQVDNDRFSLFRTREDSMKMIWDSSFSEENQKKMREMEVNSKYFDKPERMSFKTFKNFILGQDNVRKLVKIIHLWQFIF